MIAPSDMQAEFAKDFATDDTGGLQRSINRAYRWLGDAWGDNSDGVLDDGALYLAAHLRMVALRGSSGPAGQVQNKRVGDLSVSFGTHQGKVDAGSFASTAYGLEFLRMMYSLPGARINVDAEDNVYEGVVNPFVIDGPGDGFGDEGSDNDEDGDGV